MYAHTNRQTFRLLAFEQKSSSRWLLHTASRSSTSIQFQPHPRELPPPSAKIYTRRVYTCLGACYSTIPHVGLRQSIPGCNISTDAFLLHACTRIFFVSGACFLLVVRCHAERGRARAHIMISVEAAAAACRRKHMREIVVTNEKRHCQQHTLSHTSRILSSARRRESARARKNCIHRMLWRCGSLPVISQRAGCWDDWRCACGVCLAMPACYCGLPFIV